MTLCVLTLKASPVHCHAATTEEFSSRRDRNISSSAVADNVEKVRLRVAPQTLHLFGFFFLLFLFSLLPYFLAMQEGFSYLPQLTIFSFVFPVCFISNLLCLRPFLVVAPPWRRTPLHHFTPVKVEKCDLRFWMTMWVCVGNVCPPVQSWVQINSPCVSIRQHSCHLGGGQGDLSSFHLNELNWFNNQ